MAVVLVTHNIEEAVLLSDKIIVFANSGSILQEIDVNGDFGTDAVRRNSPKILQIKSLVHSLWKDNGRGAI